MRPTNTNAERETEWLRGVLYSVIRLREDVKRGMEAVVYRERVLQLKLHLRGGGRAVGNIIFGSIPISEVESPAVTSWPQQEIKSAL